MNDLETRLRDELARVAASTDAPDGLADRLLERVSEPGGRGATGRRWTAPLLAAAITVTVLAGVLVGSRFLAQRPVQTPPVAPTVSSAVPTPATSPASSAPTTRGTSGTTRQASVPSSRPPWVGRTVTATGVPFGFTAVQALFSTPQRGTLLGDASCSGIPDRCPALLRTTDGGATFRALPVPSGVTVRSAAECRGAGSSGCVSQLLDDGAGRLVLWGGSAIRSSADEGGTWQSVDDRTDISGVAVVAGRLLVSGGAEGSPGSLVSIGADGTAVAASLPASGAEGIAVVQAGPVAYALLLGDGQRRIARTTDGTRWTLLPALARCSGDVEGVPDGSVVVTCFGEDDPIAAVLPVSGSTWTTIARPAAAEGRQVLGAVIAQSADRLAFAAVPAEEAGAADFSWLSTTDGGRSWRSDADPAGGHRPLPDDGVTPLAVSAGALSAPFVVGRSLVVSADLGRTWRLVDLAG